MKSFYSQHGEDAILAEIFPQACGRYIEVGCIDGKRFSNTYHFELRGWTGLCVEAHRDYIPLLKANRPGAVVIHAAAGPQDTGSTVFYANRRGSLSTLDPSKENEFRAKFSQWFTGFEPQTVALRTLSNLIDSHPPTLIDFVSIDVEGAELDVLRGLDFSRHRPKVFVIEADDREARERLTTFLHTHKYRHLGSVSHNLFFGEESFLPSSHLRDLKLHIDLILTPHPLDQQVEQRSSVQVDWHPAR